MISQVNTANGIGRFIPDTFVKSIELYKNNLKIDFFLKDYLGEDNNFQWCEEEKILQSVLLKAAIIADKKLAETIRDNPSLLLDPAYVSRNNILVIEKNISSLVSRENNLRSAKPKKDLDGKSVPDRFKSWSVGKNIVTVCSGTYMQECNANANPVSLTIDQGNVINNTIAKMDGIVTVYSSGEIIVGNSKLGELKIANKNYNLNNSLEKNSFMIWAHNNKATVFQTHLLIYKDELAIYNNSSNNERERRFLAGCTDEEGNKYEYIINIPSSITLMDGAKNSKKYLKQKEEMKTIDYLINLDTGCQDFFEGYNSNGQKRNDYLGSAAIEQTINIISFYYQ